MLKPGFNDPPVSPRMRMNKGRWTDGEHKAFIRGIELFGKDYEAITSMVPTRTFLQIRTHCQKYSRTIEKGQHFPQTVRVEKSYV